MHLAKMGPSETSELSYGTLSRESGSLKESIELGFRLHALRSQGHAAAQRALRHGVEAHAQVPQFALQLPQAQNQGSRRAALVGCVHPEASQALQRAAGPSCCSPGPLGCHDQRFPHQERLSGAARVPLEDPSAFHCVFEQSPVGGAAVQPQRLLRAETLPAVPPSAVCRAAPASQLVIGTALMF